MADIQRKYFLKALATCFIFMQLLACSSESTKVIKNNEEKAAEQPEVDIPAVDDPDLDDPEIRYQAEIQWQPVSEFLAGSETAVISNYEIHLGTRADHLDQVFIVTDPSQTSFILKDLAEGDYFVAMVAIEENGERSDFSQSYQFTITE